MVDTASLLPLWDELSKKTGFPMGNFPGLYSAGLLRLRPKNTEAHEKDRSIVEEYCENYLSILLASIGGKEELLKNNLSELGIRTSGDLGNIFQAMINEGVLAEKKKDYKKYFNQLFDINRLDGFLKDHLVREKADILMKSGFKITAGCGLVGILGILYGLIFNMNFWILGVSAVIFGFGILYLFSDPMVRTKRRFRKLKIPMKK